MKKRIIIIGIILVIVVVIVSLIGTFASDSTVATNDNSYDITLTGSTGEILVPAGGVKTAIYQVTNTNKGVVKYGVAYSGEDIVVKVYEDTIDTVTGFMDYGESKFVKLYIKNNGTTDSIASIQAVLGYEHGGELTPAVPSGYTLVSEVYSPPKPVNMITYIYDLYTNATKTTASNSGITYNYASELGLMNDRLGGTTSNYDDGNIRYYGANPNNYIYFNCETYPETNCETWRIIGLFKDVEMADGSKQDLIKIARASTLGNYSWDYTSTGAYDNNWHNATLNTLLNQTYYTSGTTTYYNNSTTGTSVSFASTGIKNDTTRNMIAEVVWNLGGDECVREKNASYIYIQERSTEKCSSCTYDTTWLGKIALMYPSDYGYATDLSKCTEPMQWYGDESSCYSNDWLFQTNTQQWTITSGSGGSSFAWYVSSTASINSVNNTNGVHPVLYLNFELGIVEGNTGTSDDPYRIVVE